MNVWELIAHNRSSRISSLGPEDATSPFIDHCQFRENSTINNIFKIKYNNIIIKVIPLHSSSNLQLRKKNTRSRLSQIYCLPNKWAEWNGALSELRRDQINSPDGMTAALMRVSYWRSIPAGRARIDASRDRRRGLNLPNSTPIFCPGPQNSGTPTNEIFIGTHTGHTETPSGRPHGEICIPANRGDLSMMMVRNHFFIFESHFNR